MKPTYQIKDWQAHFENDRSRSRQKCSFVCVPNKQHGMGFSRIMAEPDGAAIYGIWHCMVGACSQQTNRNGWLTMDGERPVSARGVDGECAVTAWDATDMALKFRRPVKEIERAIEVLTSDKVGWIIAHNINVESNLEKDSPPGHRLVTADSPPGHLEEKRREEKEGEGMENPAHGDCDEIPTEAEAIASTMVVGIPEDFSRYVYQDWSSRGGKDAGGVLVRFLPYVNKRWARERTEWMSKQHRGKKATKPNDYATAEIDRIKKQIEAEEAAERRAEKEITIDMNWLNKKANK